MVRIQWGPIVVGALLALAAGSLAALALAGLGLTEGGSGAALLVFLSFAMQFAAGLAGGRYSTSAHVFHGANASLALYLATAALALAAGREAGPAVVLLGGVLALFIGSLGGLLGGRSRT